MTKVDLGAGVLSQNKIDRYVRYLGDGYNPDHYVGVDFRKRKGVDKVCDFEKEKLPFDDNSVDEIVTVHTLEHIHNLEHIMEECHRILKPQSLLKIWVPHCHSTSAYSEWSHVRFFGVSTLDLLDVKAWEKGASDYDFLFEKVLVKLQVSRNMYESKWYDRILENFLNKKQRRGENLLKGLPYKEWEVYYKLKKVEKIKSTSIS